ncbi:helix-turn-helix domain-containing protein [Dactylosporangium sucinum]|uniref:helix-turn-helix domain-containing protein n=1 Tax=Dactylosporangium sucinum TaxID=1424081 RepID=UPI00167DF425|nr:helix-turn-helix transcriptional regulator [Dactylosporangium sucinum]
MIAGQAGVSTKTVTRILQRRVQHVRGCVAQALLTVELGPDLLSLRVDVIGTARRLRALCSMGWSLTDLSERCLIPRQTLSSWCRERCQSIPRASAEAVAEVYDELYAVDGPCELTRALAEREGWDLHVWLDEDIDNRDAAPLDASGLVDEVAVDRVLCGERSLAATLTRQETAEVVRLGTAAGSSQSDLAQMLGTTSRQICRIRARLREADPATVELTAPVPVDEASTAEVAVEVCAPTAESVAVPPCRTHGARPGTLRLRSPLLHRLASLPVHRSAGRPATAWRGRPGVRRPGKRPRRFSAGGPPGGAPAAGRSPCGRPASAGAER